MKNRWKKMLILSSLGGMAVASVVAMARRVKTPELPDLEIQRIPEDCQRLSLWTEQFRLADGDTEVAVQDKYQLQLTPFKVWNLYQLGGGQGESKPEGATVYHVTHVRYTEIPGGDGYADEGKLQDRYYGTVAVALRDGTRSADNCIARGGILEIKKCLVGGASTGLETGEIHRSSAALVNYRFEYSAR
jgi:hypothetical protein